MDSQTALKELQNYQSTSKNAGDYYNQAQQELGVGSAQQRANDMRTLIRNTETTLKGVDASVSGRTQGSLVTEAQRQRLANLERQPIAEELGALQGGYSDEMANYRDLLAQAGTKAGLGYQSQQDRLAALEGNYNRLFGQEQAGEERRRYEADLAERKRQFDEQQRASRAAASFVPNLGNGTLQQPQASSVPDATSQTALRELDPMLKSNDKSRVLREYEAIRKSASFGNQVDKIKLQLLSQLRPDLFGGKVSAAALGNGNQLRF